MGFFKKLFGMFSSEKENNVSATDNSFVAKPQETENEPSPAESNPVHNQHNTKEEYFAALITKENFPEYEIEGNIHPKIFDQNAHPSCYPISYLFKKDGVPVLAVLVMQTNQYKAMISLGTYKILEDNNIPYLRFFKGMLNEENYVINRIKEALNQ